MKSKYLFFEKKRERERERKREILAYFKNN
jgi:hypothetical protein